MTPRDGMRILDRASGQEQRYLSGWQIAATIAGPSGGATIDASKIMQLKAETAEQPMVKQLIKRGLQMMHRGP